MVPAGGFRQPRTLTTGVATQDSQGNVRSADNLVMEGGEIFDFTIISVPASVARLLQKARLSLGDIDLFISIRPTSSCWTTYGRK